MYGLVRQVLKYALVLLYCGSLTNFGELSINVLVLRQSEANQELSLELSPRGDSVIGLVQIIPLDRITFELSKNYLHHGFLRSPVKMKKLSAREIQLIGFSIFLSGKFLPLAWVFCVLPIIILFKSTSSEFTEEFLQFVFYAGLRGFESCIYCIIHSHCINNVVFGVTVKEVGTYGMAVDSRVAAGGSIGNHDNVAGRGRRGQQQGDVGEGDLGGRGGKGNGGKQGQRLGKQRLRDNDGRHRSTAVAGKPWQFHYSYWSSNQSYVLTKGWSCFIKEKLDAGDVILFERQGGEEGPLGNRGGSGCVASTRAMTRAVSRRRQQRGEEDGPAKGPRWQRAGSRRQQQRGEERKKG
ncbi:hypothetical protein BHE74_00046038 [Ensete ventricosum]|nr:hypothetical protein BHE74_00046038 [Ensete ventricosum]